MLRQHTEQRPDTWDNHLARIRMTMNTHAHETTGVTPFRAWFSRCEEATMKLDLFMGPKVEVKIASCHRQWLVQQLRSCLEIYELVREHTAAQSQVQATTRLRAGLRIREYKPGDLVWRYYPPHKADKFNPSVWTGPYKVLETVPTQHVVKLMIPSLGRGGQPKPTWVHTSNVKPVQLTADGKLFNTQLRDDDMLDLGEVPLRCPEGTVTEKRSRRSRLAA